MIEIVNAVLYGGLGVVGVLVWRRRKTRPAMWLAVTFVVLAFIVLQGLLVPVPDPETAATRFSLRQIYGDIVVVLLLSTPWLLFRFVRSLRAKRTLADLAADLGMATIFVTTVAAPPFPTDPDGAPVWFTLYYVGALAWWCVMLGAVAWQLWRAGRGQPGVVRRRMRLMALGALLINAALLAPAFAGDAGDTNSMVALVTAMLGWAGGIGFWLGVEPPRPLRRVWRVEDEIALREADIDLTRADTAEEAAAAVVQAAASIIGGAAARIDDGDGRRLAAFGNIGEDEEVLRVQGEASAVIVSVSPYTPVFGADEEMLLRQLCAHLDLAIRRIQAYEASERDRRQTQQVNEDLQQLVYGISHDLRNPLVTILGFLQLLQIEAPQLSDQGRLALDRIGASAQYMDNLIQDLLQLSRIGRTDSEADAVDLGPMVTEIAADVAARHDDVHVDVVTDVRVWMNPVRARQLFTNLLENAARHGGRRPLTVVVRSADSGPDQVIVDVRDDGVGIPAADRQRVFAIFQRLEGFDAGSPGSGIGLTMCQRIAEDAGGSIGVVDAAVGTTIRLVLPLPPDAMPSRDRLDRLQPTGVPTP